MIDLILARYGGLTWLNGMDAGTAVDVLLQAIKNKKKEEIREQWVVQLPLMAIKYLEYKRFEDYYTHLTGGDIDTRPTEEILAEVAEVRKYTGG